MPLLRYPSADMSETKYLHSIKILSWRRCHHSMKTIFSFTFKNFSKLHRMFPPISLPQIQTILLYCLY